MFLSFWGKGKYMDNKNKRDRKTPPMKNPMVVFLVLSIVATIVLNTLMGFLLEPKKVEITYDKFMELIDKGKVDEVIIESDKFTIIGKETEKESSEVSMFGIGYMGETQTEQPIYYTGYLNDERLFE